VPKHISSDCGVCIRFTPDARPDVESVLAGAVDIVLVRPLR